MTFKTFAEKSKEEWGREWEEDTNPSNENLHLGYLARISLALESIQESLEAISFGDRARTKEFKEMEDSRQTAWDRFYYLENKNAEYKKQIKKLQVIKKKTI